MDPKVFTFFSHPGLWEATSYASNYNLLVLFYDDGSFSIDQFPVFKSCRYLGDSLLLVVANQSLGLQRAVYLWMMFFISNRQDLQRAPGEGSRKQRLIETRLVGPVGRRVVQL